MTGGVCWAPAISKLALDRLYSKLHVESPAVASYLPSVIDQNHQAILAAHR